MAAAVTAKMGSSLEAVAAEARGGPGREARAPRPRCPPAAGARRPPADGRRRSGGSRCATAHGLHARPAARFVQTAAAFDADVRVRNLTNGRGPADAASLNARGDARRRGTATRSRCARSGPQAAEALAAIAGPGRAELRRGREDVARPATARRAGGRGAAVGALGRDAGVARRRVRPGAAIPGRRRSRSPTSPPPTPPRRPRHSSGALERHGRRHRAPTRGRGRPRRRGRRPRSSTPTFCSCATRRSSAPARPAIREDRRTAARAWHEAVEQVAASLGRPRGRLPARAGRRSAQRRPPGARAAARASRSPRPELARPGILVAADLTPADTAGARPRDGARDRDGARRTDLARRGARALARHPRRRRGRRGARSASTRERPLAARRDRGHRARRSRRPRLARARRRAAGRARRPTARRPRRSREPATTLDGVTVEVAANVGGAEEVAAAVAAGADGVGLFRTEFLFMGRDAMPDEDEQEAAYRAAADALDGPAAARPHARRRRGQADPLSRRRPDEANPFLGVRGHPARPRAPRAARGAAPRGRSRGGRPPGARDVPDGRHARRAPRGSRRSLERGASRAVAPRAALEVGVMIEVPAAALIADRARGGGRLLLDRHERPHAVHAGGRPRERARGAG